MNDDGSDSEISDDDMLDLDADQRRIVTRNATTVLLRNMQAYLRFMRVDVCAVENQIGRTARVVAMGTRIEEMERMIEVFEDSVMMMQVPRQLFP